MRINEFISEFLMNVPIKVKLSNSENVDGDFVKGLMICNICLAIQIKNGTLNKNTYDLFD